MPPPFPLGTIVNLEAGDPAERFADVARLGLESVQLACWQPRRLTPANAARVRDAAADHGLTVTTFWAGTTGPAKWNLLEGPRTIGLVPDRYRDRRTDELIRALTFARRIEAPSITTHLGFLPEDPADPRYRATVRSVRKVADAAEAQELGLWFETGQETPVTLKRCLDDVGGEHLGVNFDPANLVMYGKANPVDALQILGPHVRGFHAKDGRYPTRDPRVLGEETAIGRGDVDFPALLQRLRALRYRGPLTIEREIEGPRQRRDIQRAIRYLRSL
jgi:sugar phosphate isomerase/epimerase